jgi:hypothetical protein
VALTAPVKLVAPMEMQCVPATRSGSTTTGKSASHSFLNSGPLASVVRKMAPTRCEANSLAASISLDWPLDPREYTTSKPRLGAGRDAVQHRHGVGVLRTAQHDLYLLARPLRVGRHGSDPAVGRGAQVLLHPATGLDGHVTAVVQHHGDRGDGHSGRIGHLT